MSAKPIASRSLTAVLSSALVALTINSAKAAPPIRTSDRNLVPACVTPERLMAFLAERNPHFDPRYKEIARWYKYFGEGWRVRWDYAFFQMALETNYLTYRRGDGSRGDVWENQNNFAGIGATGGGVRGERFPDVKTGVHAQIQHLVAYSGEHLAAPIAKRTRQNQDDIIAQSNRLGRPVTFGDLARRWATDRSYAKSIDFVAGLYNAHYCNQPARSAEDVAPPAPLQIRHEWRYPFRPPSGLGGPKPMDLAGPEPDDAP
ncbi:MAG: glucosaminidase domain-containing protein, partial [Hyphomicrobium sp.]